MMMFYRLDTIFVTDKNFMFYNNYLFAKLDSVNFYHLIFTQMNSPLSYQMKTS